ncbi:response regulator [bacterium]|nr:response regulator [bacterium]
MRQAAGSQLRVLVVESYKHHEAANALVGYLRSQGCSVDQIDAGWHAWQIMHILKYSVVIMDLRLRDISGLELLRLMRALDSAPPTILGMDNQMPSIQRIAMNMGAAECYVKPLPPEEVFELMIRVLDCCDETDGYDNQLAA